jgi:hypothetical protein
VADGYGVLDGVVHIEEGAKVLRRRRILYATCSATLAAIMLLAVLDAVTSVAVYGVETERTRASSGGYELGVRYGSVTRPALATPFDIEVTRSGGFDGPVTVAVSSDYLAMWDANGLDPEPAESTRDSRFTYWTFEPPADGDTLEVSFDARIEPAVQHGRKGTVAVLDASGAVAVDVEFETWVWP